MSDNSPRGNVIERSINTNLVFGVEAAEEELLAERMRSCGQVKVAFWKATVPSCSSGGGTGETSAPRRYFSMRRNETTLCDELIRPPGQV
jgi:DnaJ-class molecular chaperone